MVDMALKIDICLPQRRELMERTKIFGGKETLLSSTKPYIPFSWTPATRDGGAQGLYHLSQVNPR